MVEYSSECIVCRHPSIYDLGQGSPMQADSWRKVTCTRCGTYRLAYSTSGTTLTPRQTANASGWLRENPETLLSRENIKELSNLQTPSIEKRIYRLLMWISQKTESTLGKAILLPLNNESDNDLIQELLGYCYCLDFTELEFLIYYLRENGLIRSKRNPGLDETELPFHLSVHGINHLAKFNKYTGNNNAFCAMWFSDTVDHIWLSAIHPAIELAEYSPIRVNELNYIGGISDKALSLIRQCKFVVADLTGHRQNVYYEAGFARGLGKPVILTCEKDEIETSHFDVKHLNILEWEKNNLENFKYSLNERIQSIFGKGTEQFIYEQETVEI